MNSNESPGADFITVKDCKSSMVRKLADLASLHGGEFRLGRSETGLQVILDPQFGPWSDTDIARTGWGKLRSYYTKSGVNIFTDQGENFEDLATYLIEDAIRRRDLVVVFLDDTGELRRAATAINRPNEASGIAYNGVVSRDKLDGHLAKYFAFTKEADFDLWLSTHVRLERDSFSHYVGEQESPTQNPSMPPLNSEKAPAGSESHFDYDKIPPIEKSGRPGKKRGSYEIHLWKFLWWYFNEVMEEDEISFQREELSKLRQLFESHCRDQQIDERIPQRNSFEAAVKDLRLQIIYYVEDSGNPTAPFVQANSGG